MARPILFLHGGGSRDDYEADAKIVASLHRIVGTGYSIHYPFLANDGTPDLGRRRQISAEFDTATDDILIVAHSLGASMLLACLSEHRITKKIGGVFLLATPFWQGDEDWVKAFMLQPHFSQYLDTSIPLFFYHCHDGKEVSFNHMAHYKQHVPWATFRELPAGGHQFDADVTPVANDIQALSGQVPMRLILHNEQ